MDILNNWECRTKTASVIVWLVCVMSCSDVGILLEMLLFLACFLWGLTRIKISVVLHRLRHMLPFLLLMLVTLSISDGFPIKKEALDFAFIVCIRVITAAFLLLVLSNGENMESFIRSLAQLGLPETYITLLFMTNRYIYLITNEFSQQMNILKSRMFKPKLNLNSMKNTGYIIGGMFIKAYVRSEEIYRAMKSRNFQGVLTYEKAAPITPAHIGKMIVFSIVPLFLLGFQKIF